MTPVRKYNFSLILVFLCATLAFAFTYNYSVKSAISTSVSNNRELLKAENAVLIEKLTRQEDTSSWQKILNRYSVEVVTVYDSNNNVVAKSKNLTQTPLSVSEMSAFEFNSKAYLIVSSAFLLQNFDKGNPELFKFVLMEFVIAIIILVLLILFIYTLVIRPYKEFYFSIEEYEKTGKFTEKKFSGYLGRVYERFGAMTKNLQHQKENQERIVASISHDIKTPLTSIMGYSERLGKDNITEERRKRYAETVYTKSIEIRELVDEFDEYISYKMLQALNLEAVSSAELCQSLKTEYEDELNTHGVELKIYNNAPTMTLMLDTVKMRRVFGNLIGNSLKHFRPSGSKIIAITVSDKENGSLITFEDSGEGVDEEKCEVIFEPLYTSDRGRKVAGLGLAICREIVESHAGKISAARSQLGGLKINIELM